MTLRPSRVFRPRHQRGMTLIELLVSVGLGLVITLAVTSVIVMGEAQKRTTTGNNDMGQSGAYAATVLDRALRSAGSGFSQGWGELDRSTFGCQLHAARTGTEALPNAGLPAPFAGLLSGATGGSAALRLAPVLIGQSQSAAGSDILAVLSGNGGTGDIPRFIRNYTDTGSGTASIRLDNTIALAKDDLVLVGNSSANECLLQQISTQPVLGADELLLGGTYFRAGSGGNALSSVAGADDAYVVGLGNATADNVQFHLFGVGTNRVLFRHDLLQSSGNTSEAVADGVVQVRALYGVDNSTPRDQTLDAWVKPTGDYAINNIVADATTTRDRARRIVAVRVAVLLRSAVYEKEVVAQAKYEMFSSLPADLRYSFSPTGDDLHYRYRIVETTIPLRNQLLTPQPDPT